MENFIFSKKLGLAVDERIIPFNENDPIYFRTEPVSPWDAANNTICNVCEKVMKKAEKTYWWVWSDR